MWLLLVPELKSLLSLDPEAFCDPENSWFSSSSPFFLSFELSYFNIDVSFLWLLPKSFLGSIVHVYEFGYTSNSSIHLMCHGFLKCSVS